VKDLNLSILASIFLRISYILSSYFSSNSYGDSKMAYLAASNNLTDNKESFSNLAN